MAMVVKNNMSAVSTLNTLNKNSNALQKSLSKVSSGMKINSAQDDASGYAISERMRVQIRSLDQANQNTQNGSSMMKTAEGAVSSTVEILKSLKEKAINAANDTNTDSDRVTIQKEIDQFIDQVDDNALTTFNGKYLVDGSKNNAHNDTYATFTNQNMDVNTSGATYLAEDNSAGSTDTAKNRIGESLEINSTDYVTASFVKDGKTHTTTFRVGDSTVSDIFKNLNSVAVADGEEEVFGGAQIPSTEAAASTTSSSSSSGSYSLDELKSALETAKSALADKQAALEAANAAAGDFTWDTAGKTVSSDSDKTYGAAGELANAINEAAKLNDDGTQVADATTGGDYLKVVNTADANTAKEFSVGNLTSGTAVEKAWNGRNLDDATNMTNSKQHLEDAISSMTSATNATVAEAGEKLKTAYTNYNLAISELKDAQDAYDTAKNDVEVLTNAIAAIEAKTEADAMTDTMVSNLEQVFDGLAHPGGAATGVLLNDNWVGTKDDTLTLAAYSADKAYKYSNDDDALNKVATGITNDIATNVAAKATGADVSAAQTAAYTEMKESLKNMAQVNGSATGEAAAPTTAFTAANYTSANVTLDGASEAFDASTSKGIDGTVFQDYANKIGEYAYAKAQTDANTLSGDLKKAMDRNAGSSGGDSGLVHVGTDIGTNKSGDRVDTADGTTGLTVTAGKAGVAGQISGITISISDSDGNVKKAANAALDKFAMPIRAENRTTAGKDANNNLTFQVGAEANQAISVSLTDMRSEALGLKGSDGTKVSVATQDKANAAVAVFDNAISKALDQQTTIGSIEARLEYTSSNLTTSSENVQAAESTIRDADMAKEMTNYTKNNVLLQAAQSMLAQANQSSSAVLSLLQ